MVLVKRSAQGISMISMSRFIGKESRDQRSGCQGTYLLFKGSLRLAQMSCFRNYTYNHLLPYVSSLHQRLFLCLVCRSFAFHNALIFIPWVLIYNKGSKLFPFSPLSLPIDLEVKHVSYIINLFNYSRYGSLALFLIFFELSDLQ